MKTKKKKRYHWLVPTDAEQLFLHRRRTGRSQRRAAKRAGVPVARYCGMELGTEVVAPELRVEVGAQPHELAVLARRRRGWTQAQLAHRLRYCRFWVMRMETGQADPLPLLEHWGLS